MSKALLLLLALVMTFATMSVVSFSHGRAMTSTLFNTSKSLIRTRTLTSHLSMGPKEKTAAAIKDNKVMVFSKTYCPYCQKAKAALTDLGVKFTVQELDLDEKEGPAIQQALLDLTGQRTVPNIFIKGVHLGGCDSTLAAIADGKLKKMLEA